LPLLASPLGQKLRLCLRARRLALLLLLLAPVRSSLQRRHLRSTNSTVAAPLHRMPLAMATL
jgi:hypothetical protein